MYTCVRIPSPCLAYLFFTHRILVYCRVILLFIKCITPIQSLFFGFIPFIFSLTLCFMLCAQFSLLLVTSLILILCFRSCFRPFFVYDQRMFVSFLLLLFEVDDLCSQYTGSPRLSSKASEHAIEPLCYLVPDNNKLVRIMHHISSIKVKQT